MGAIDEALESCGLKPKIFTTVGGFSAAIALARASDFIATVLVRYTDVLREGMHCFPLPVATHEFTVSMLWHPHIDADQPTDGCANVSAMCDRSRLLVLPNQKGRKS